MSTLSVDELRFPPFKKSGKEVVVEAAVLVDTDAPVADAVAAATVTAASATAATGNFDAAASATTATGNFDATVGADTTKVETSTSISVV